jgi:hypothetical protein
VITRLFISYYYEKNAVRRREINACLERNLSCELLHHICVLVEGDCSPPFESPKLLTRRIASRPTYEHYFSWVNELTENEDTAIIANSDIVFNQTLHPLLQRIPRTCCAALSRWDVQSNGIAKLFDRNDSQDVWVFKGPVRAVRSNFLIGVPRCDNRILHELRAAGYHVINPAFSVETLHLHSGERTEYPAFIDGPHVSPPYSYIWPHNLLSLPSTIWWNLLHPSARIKWRFDPRYFANTGPMRALSKLLHAFYHRRNNAR